MQNFSSLIPSFQSRVFQIQEISFTSRFFSRKRSAVLVEMKVTNKITMNLRYNHKQIQKLQLNLHTTEAFQMSHISVDLEVVPLNMKNTSKIK